MRYQLYINIYTVEYIFKPLKNTSVNLIMIFLTSYFKVTNIH